ncbi:LPS export ABC transporter periplasmic protein LptC [Pararhodospirillum oryzae]|uniref:LPS export ABC transporter periplasmic protein LptC n=1 Tax=Pararhodospirillum oryzae TaxID=478448 RepID=A0A512H7W1_9PROT|nr:LPS export ABC transporter periplasmic protein LptC [Pararhodospirillum oryzae]GEO81546.1 hypothetical protein ROR02_16770 [Pararhodospirillum oryzae]
MSGPGPVVMVPDPESLPLRVRSAAVPARYGRFVASMKLLLPGLATITLGVLVAWPWINDHTAGLALGFATFDPRSADFSSILNPRYMGTDRDNNPYVVTADTATDLGSGDGRLRLINPKGDLLQASGRWLSLSSDVGYLTNTNQHVELESNVLFYRDDGLQFRTQSAMIELDKNRAYGNDPVQGEGPDYDIVSEGFAIEEGGERIVFSGHARLLLHESSAGGGGGLLPGAPAPAPTPVPKPKPETAGKGRP